MEDSCSQRPWVPVSPTAPDSKTLNIVDLSDRPNKAWKKDGMEPHHERRLEPESSGASGSMPGTRHMHTPRSPCPPGHRKGTGGKSPPGVESHLRRHALDRPVRRRRASGDGERSATAGGAVELPPVETERGALDLDVMVGIVPLALQVNRSTATERVKPPPPGRAQGVMRKVASCRSLALDEALSGSMRSR
ncbi:hypothetical protein Psuf_000050 [Phytohabitans suffuscus]|uniref:Uncharacterized protein n=1 Tax=Phytohabitans suffuscus TaxID=624315 RepID=A0A6F8Y9A2_9ACTN|nr:hypothetical protein Psuf_000050 [Phytohabitans suffuscus]